MEDNEKKLYDKLIQMYEEKIANLEKEKRELERELLYQKITPKDGYSYFPYPQGPNDWPYNQPWWGITDPRTNDPISPTYTGEKIPEWKTTTSTSAKVSDCMNNTVTHSVVNPTKLDYTVSVYAESDKIATYDPKTKKTSIILTGN